MSWFKVEADFYNHPKIKTIESSPDKYGWFYSLIWIKLLALACKCNAGGRIEISENIPFSVNELSAEFNISGKKNKKLLENSLEIFKNLEMIFEKDKFIYIKNWSIYQNIDGMEKVKMQGRIKQKKWYDKNIRKPREEEKNKKPNVSPNVILTQPNSIDIELDKNIEEEKNKEKNEEIVIGIVNNPLLNPKDKEQEFIEKINKPNNDNENGNDDFSSQSNDFVYQMIQKKLCTQFFHQEKYNPHEVLSDPEARKVFEWLEKYDPTYIGDCIDKAIVARLERPTLNYISKILENGYSEWQNEKEKEKNAKLMQEETQETWDETMDELKKYREEVKKEKTKNEK
jgi:predicted phage replisome organizer